MAGPKPTLAEYAMRQQVRAANRDAFVSFWQRGTPQTALWAGLFGVVGIIAGSVMWRLLV